MRYINIGKAMSHLSTSDRVGGVVEQIALKLSQKTQPEVKSLNTLLGFSLPFFTRRTFDTDDMLANRRGAMLMAKTLGPLPARGKTVYNPESWDNGTLEEYISTQKQLLRDVQRPTVTGAVAGTYFSAGYWVHATDADRTFTLDAWREGKELCGAGLMAVMNAMRGVESANALVSLWFGDKSDRAEIKRVLQESFQGMNTKFICFTYAGPIPDAGLSIYEAGFGSHGGYTETHVKDAWAEVGQIARQSVFLCKNFFDAAQTSGPLSKQITGIEEGMQVSRGGCMLHEATHMFGDTKDVQVTDAVYEQFGLKPPAEGATRAQGYGPGTCLALAKADEEKAVKNADNYRMFCEAARFFRDKANVAAAAGVV